MTPFLTLFETFIIGELVKSRFNQGGRADLFFWRDSNGNEVDVIAEQQGKLMPLEIKSGKTLAKDIYTTPTLIYGGDESYRHNDIRITGWQESGAIF